ncbi:hypothetical protein PM082_024147 [Marasmius tenuissimus]|nr:hypothetical protein PM082_024147 [Marasmius tenuissimus]
MQLLHSPSEAATLNPTSSDSYFEILTFLDYVSLGFVLIHLLINGFLTSVIARKILLSRARQGLASTTGDRFRTLAILLVESFLLYLIGWAVFAACILSRLRNFMVFDSVLVQVLGIAPTLLTVQANIQKDKSPTEVVTRDQPPCMTRTTTSESVDEDIVLYIVGDRSTVHARS